MRTPSGHQPTPQPPRMTPGPPPPGPAGASSGNANRALAHIRTLAEELKNALDPDDQSPAGVFMSGAINGLAMAKRILDGATAEQALEGLETQIATVIGRAHIASHGTHVQAHAPGPGQQIISDADTYPAILADAQRHTELLDWLRANGIDPNDVPADSTVSIEPSGDSYVIRYTAFALNPNGTRRTADNNATATEKRTTPLIVALPEGWAPPVTIAPKES